MAEGDGLLNGNSPLVRPRFPRKFFRFFHFPDRASWLLLALEAWFWCSQGQFWGQFPLPPATRIIDLTPPPKHPSASSCRKFAISNSTRVKREMHIRSPVLHEMITGAASFAMVIRGLAQCRPVHTGSTPGRARLQQEGTDPVHRPRLRAVAVPSRAVRPRPIGSRQSCSPSGRPSPASWLRVNCF